MLARFALVAQHCCCVHVMYFCPLHISLVCTYTYYLINSRNERATATHNDNILSLHTTLCNYNTIITLTTSHYTTIHHTTNQTIKQSNYDNTKSQSNIFHSSSSSPFTISETIQSRKEKLCSRQTNYLPFHSHSHNPSSSSIIQ